MDIWAVLLRRQQLVEDGVEGGGLSFLEHGVKGGISDRGVDTGKAVVGSQNWSGDGTVRNRDASLLIESANVNAYFREIFDHDWERLASADLDGAQRGQTEADTLLADSPETPAGYVRMPWRDYYGD